MVSISLLAIGVTPKAFSCQITNTDRVLFFQPEDKKTILSVGEKSLEVFGCSRKDKKKFLNLATGPDLINLNYERGWSYTGFFHDDYCKAEVPAWVEILQIRLY